MMIETDSSLEAVGLVVSIGLPPCPTEVAGCQGFAAHA